MLEPKPKDPGDGARQAPKEKPKEQPAKKK